MECSPDERIWLTSSFSNISQVAKKGRSMDSNNVAPSDWPYELSPAAYIGYFPRRRGLFLHSYVLYTRHSVTAALPGRRVRVKLLGHVSQTESIIGHGWQKVEPDSFCQVSSGQSWHSRAPLTFENLPAGHSMQVLCFEKLLKLPGVHGLHGLMLLATPLSKPYVPVGQNAMQSPADVAVGKAVLFSGPHSWQVLAPALEYAPYPHSLHALAPVPSIYLPPGH